MSDELKMKNLQKLIKVFKGTLPQGRVGILGGKGRREDGSSNAEIGARHEYGTEELPQRSFLREPITDQLASRVEQAGGDFSKAGIKKIIREGTIRPWVEKLTLLSEAIVLEGFDTGGFGKWKPSDMKFKKNKQTLVETQQLRNSITSGVKG